MDRLMNEWVDEWMYELTNGWMNIGEWMDGWIDRTQVTRSHELMSSPRRVRPRGRYQTKTYRPNCSWAPDRYKKEQYRRLEK